MFIEGLRTDSLWVGPFRISQVLAGLIFISCLALLIYFAIKPPKKVFFTYTSKYEKAALLKKEKKAQKQEAKESITEVSKEETDEASKAEVQEVLINDDEPKNENNQE